MKKFYFLFWALQILFCSESVAQNFVLHYDFGEERQMITSTIELFKADEYGSTFFFVDIDYGSKTSGLRSEISLAYFEIIRGLKFWDAPLEIHAEYNGGIGQFKNSNQIREAFTINNAWLLGGHYTFHDEGFDNTFTIQAMYKYIQNKHNVSFQFTLVWNFQLVKSKIYFQGFADFWREDHVFFQFTNESPQTTQYVFLTEPQLWFQLFNNLSIGGEVEIGNNFSGRKGLKVNPTLAFKWVIN